MSINTKNYKTESDNFKVAGSLAVSPTIAVGLFLNTGIIHLALEFLSASEKVKARDPRTLLNVYKDAPGHVPTQMLGYLNSFYENLWENWTHSAEKSLSGKFEIIDNLIKSSFNVSDGRDIYREIQEAWSNHRQIPGPNPSPTSFQTVEQNPKQQGPQVGVI